MKLFTFIVSLLLTAQISSATSLHPCTPNVEMMPMQMFCRDTDTNTSYSIKIQTWVSQPSAMCQGKNHFETRMATVLSGPVNGPNSKPVTIYNDEFEFSLGNGGAKGFFKSPKYNLNLDDCVSPMHGGFSVGN